MSGAVYPVSVQLVDSFYLSTTGITNANFSKLLFKDGVASADAITVTESGTSPGVYNVSFTPSAAGFYTYLVWETAKPKIRWTENFQVGDAIPSAASVADAILDELVSAHLTAGSLGDYINRVKKYVANRLVITGTTYSVKEDNGSTEFQGGTITTGERAPS